MDNTDETKVCKKCLKDLPLDCFYPVASRKDGRCWACKECEQARKMAWKKKHPEQVKASNQKWRDAHRKQKAEYNHEYTITHRRQRNERERKKGTLIEFRLKCNLRRRVHKTIIHGEKSAPTFKLLGCTTDQIRQYLESLFTEGMTWENYGRTNCALLDGWQIDHIIPCSAFDLTKPAEQKKCFHYTNLQPMWARENMVKGCKIEAQQTTGKHYRLQPRRRGRREGAKRHARRSPIQHQD